MPPTSLLEEALDSWADTRRGVIAELQNIPGRQMDFRPSPEMRSVAELAQHIIASSLMWAGELSDEAGDFTRQSFADFVEQYAPGIDRHRTRSVLVRVLKSTHARGARHLRAAGEVGMLQTIRRFDGERWTRLTWMYHGIAHEEYHRAQIALYARLLGRTPALTTLILAG